MRAEQRQRLLGVLQPVVDAMQHEDDFINTVEHTVEGDDCVVVLFEEWRCTVERFLSFHIPKEYRAEYTVALPEVLESEREVTPIWSMQGKGS